MDAQPYMLHWIAVDEVTNSVVFNSPLRQFCESSLGSLVVLQLNVTIRKSLFEVIETVSGCRVWIGSLPPLHLFLT